MNDPKQRQDDEEVLENDTSAFQNAFQDQAEDVLDEDDDRHGIRDETVIQIQDNLYEREFEEALSSFTDLSPSDQADLFEKLEEEPRLELANRAYDQISPVVYAEMSADVRNKILSDLSPKEVALIVSELESDDALDLISGLDDDFQREILKKLSATTRAAVEEGLTFAEKSAGRLMQREVVAVPQFWTVGKTLDYLRAAAEHLPNNFASIYIVDPRYHVLGEVSVSRVLCSSRSIKIMDLKSDSFYKVKATTHQEEVAFLFNKEHLYSTPVVDDDDRLIGIITVDDIMEVIRDEAGDDILKLGGVTGTSDIYKAVLETTKSRFSWLAINLLTAIMASLVIGLFQAPLEQLVALAVLMPIVASMGGNAGTQSLTIAVRALATRELSSANAWRFIAKETMVGLLNGIAFAILVGIIAWLWFNNAMLGVVIGVAMVINMITAGLFGITIPIILDKLKIDPALASAVFLTTVTDIVGFFAFLGLAATILL